jgi:trans-aconitate methyltransferase
MTETRKAHWQGMYARKDEDEVSWYQARPDLSLRLIANTGLGRDAAIIDAGAGASRLVDHLLEEGYADITVLDIAEAALEKARARLGERAERVNWIVADLLRWRPDRRYDIWHDRAVFHFLTEAEDRAHYVEALKSALAPGGHVIIATFAPDGPEKCSGLPVMRHSPESIAAALGEGFELVEMADEHHVTPAGRRQHFNYARLKRVA